MSLKAKIRNIAKQKNIPAQVILQNYMFERLLVRLAASEYKDKFVLKGGMLVAAIVGLDNRATMDLDTTLTKHSHEKILAAFAAGEADILIGTQMIAKGHDYPNVTLVGIMAADLSLNADSFTAAETGMALD